MLDEPGDELDEVVGLYRLSEWILSLLQDARYGRVQVAALARTYSKIFDALDFLNSYEQASEAGEQDLAHEYGMVYSQLMSDVNDLIEQLKEDGIVIVLQ